MAGLRSAFPRWAEPWNRLGLWLSLWDEHGECVDALPGAPFWALLNQHSRRFQRRLRQLARAAQDGRVQVAAISPGAPGLRMLVVPIAHRQRVIGSVLACGLEPEFFDGEGVARFCSQHELDAPVCTRLAGELPCHSEPTLRSFAEIISHHVESFSLGALASRDVGDLSAHLAQAYEELNLIYRVSTNLTVLQRPAEHFEQLCSELITSTVVESFAAVLEPVPAGGEPAVLRAGPVKASDGELIRLYRQLGERSPNAGPSLVINGVSSDAALAWAAPWLRQLIRFDLSRNDRRFGGLLALNHADGNDFGSEEVQLINAVAERSAVFLENVRLYEDLEGLFMGMLHALVSSIDAKDPYTCGHSQRVAWLSRHLAALAGVSAVQARRAYLSGLLHDIGKIGISESVLRKTGRLTEAEFDEMRRHPEIGARILQAVPQVQDVIPGVLHHHERFDGRGYPRGLSGEDIPLFGRAIGLADSLDAMTTSRTYRQACPVEIAVAEMRRCAGTQFDPALVERLLQEDLRALLRQMNESAEQPIGGQTELASPPMVAAAPRGGRQEDAP